MIRKSQFFVALLTAPILVVLIFVGASVILHGCGDKTSIEYGSAGPNSIFIYPSVAGPTCDCEDYSFEYLVSATVAGTNGTLPDGVSVLGITVTFTEKTSGKSYMKTIDGQNPAPFVVHDAGIFKFSATLSNNQKVPPVDVPVDGPSDCRCGV